MARRVVVVGAGSTGRALASRLGLDNEVVVVDPDPEACRTLGEPRSLAEVLPSLGGAPGVHVACGDASSRLVLAALAEGVKRPALAAASGRDDVNLEAGRLARDLGFEPILAVQNDPDSSASYAAERVSTVDRGGLVADHVQRALRHAGAAIPIGVGLGRGELLEVRLLKSSPVIGRPLKDISSDRWRVAAVFRGQSVVLPTGSTTLQAEDRVLLVGDPESMPDIAEHVRMGKPQFPQPWGQRVLTLERGGPDEALAAEAARWVDACGCTPLLRGFVAGPDRKAPSRPTPSGVGQPEVLPSPDDARFVDSLLRLRPGVLVTRSARARRWSVFWGQGSQDARLCDAVPIPVLFARGGGPYRHILLPVSGSGMTLAGLELAIDLTRQHGAALTALSVDLPRLLTGFGEEARRAEIEPVRRLCDLYGVHLDDVHRVGNPILRILEESAHHDLVVLTRRRNRQDGWSNPDIALRVARRAACSALVLTVGGPV